MATWNGTDQEAKEIFHGFFDKEYEKLIRCAISYLKLKKTDANLMDRAEDVVQEMFSQAWTSRHEVLSRETPIGWLYEALQYKVKEYLREENKWEKRLRRYKEFYASPPESHISLKFELDGIISREDLDLLYRKYVIGYSYKELCRETGLTKQALATKIHRIKKKVQEKL